MDRSKEPLFLSSYPGILARRSGVGKVRLWAAIRTEMVTCAHRKMRKAGLSQTDRCVSAL